MCLCRVPRGAIALLLGYMQSLSNLMFPRYSKAGGFSRHASKPFLTENNSEGYLYS
jgi:hypothetical protein